MSAFGDLYDLHVSKIYRFLYHKTFDVTVSEDLTQETFFKALRKIDSFHGETEEEFSSWLYTIAYHVSIDHFRHTSDTDSLDESSEMVAESYDIGQNIDQKVKLASVMEYLNTLKTDQKELVIMRIWDDLSYAEISAITGKSVDACKKAISRLLMQIQSNVVSIALMIQIFIFFTK